METSLKLRTFDSIKRQATAVDKDSTKTLEEYIRFSMTKTTQEQVIKTD